MRIKIVKSGHQYYSKVIGDVIEWTQTVEVFDNKFFQVPAVILKTEDAQIVVYSLEQRLYDIVVEEIF